MNSIELYSFLKMPKLARRFPYLSCHMCVFCDRIFEKINHRRGMVVNERPFGIKCKLCCRSFKNKNSLGCHKRNFHFVMKSRDLIANRAEKTDQDVITQTTDMPTEQIRVKCNICFKAYSNMNSLRTHKHIYHKSIKPQVLAENSLEPAVIAQPRDSSIELTQHNPPLALDRNEVDKDSLTVEQGDQICAEEQNLA